MAKKYKNNKYFNTYQTGGSVSTDQDSSRVQKIREKVQQAREDIGQANVFLDDWNKQRLATGRFNDQLGNGLIDIQKSNRDSTPIYSSPTAYGINSYLRAMPLVKSKDMTDEEAEIKRMNDALQYSRNLRQRILNTTEGGVQGSVLGEYNPKAKTIYANPEGGESTLLHEQTHASQATPQENKISEILGTSNTSGTYYYDRPTEVYSRLMQFRQANNLDPNEIITKDKLKEFKKSATDFDLLFRYKDKELLDLFNNVASVDTPLNNNVNFAAYGGRVNKFDLGGPVKAWNTSPNIPNKLTNPLGDSPITNTLSRDQKFTTKLGLGSNFMGNLGSSITGFLGSGQGINMISNAAFGLLNPNGNSTGVGNAMQTIGGLASNIPGVGGLIGAGVGMLGGLVNTAFGSKINEENVAQFRNQNKQQANYTSNASTNEELLADFASMSHLANVSKKDVGSDGWFSHKARNLTRDINAERQRANLAAITSLGNTAQTVDTTNDLLKGYNFSAYGGPINMRYTGTMSPFGNQFKDGGIYIKPENRGKFTALKERTGKSATWFKQHGTPAQKKMATFALNARKWKYEDGGPLEGLTPQERLNVALGRTPSGRPLEQGLINIHPEMMFMPSGNLNTVGNITGNLGLSFGKKAAVKSLRGLEYVIRNTDKLKKKVDNTVYDVIDDITEAAIEGAPELSNVLNKASKTTKRTYKRFKNSKATPALFQDEDNEIVNNENMYKTSLGEGHEDYAFGGELTHGGIFSNGIQEINNGGTHEQNPYEGIQVGVDEQNIPNLVEEGELIWNDYVFSNRLNVPKSVRQKYKLRNTKDLKFAEAAKQLQKESEERPNDPISKNGLNAALSDLANEQEYIRMNKQLKQNTFAYGGSKGNIFDGTGPKSQKLKTYKNYTQLPQNTDFYTPQYMNFWNWMDKNRGTEEANNWLKRINSGEFGNIGGNTFNMDDIMRLSHDYKRGPVHNAFELASSDFERGRSLGNLGIFNQKVPTIKPITIFEEELPEEEEIKYTPEKSQGKFKESPLRYAPIVGHAAGVISDIFSKPDYQAADEVRNIELNPSLVGFTPIGNKLRFTPYDINFQINKANANAGASRRNIMNTSGGNRAAAMAGLMGVDTNYYNALGDAYRQALQYNDARRDAVEAFNRATDQYNSEMGLKASMANAESRNAMTKARYERDKNAALLGQQARDAYNTRLSNNLNILLEDIGNLGRERNIRNWLDILADKDVLKMNTKGQHVSSDKKEKKNGSKLNRKKKGGWEYV